MLILGFLRTAGRVPRGWVARGEGVLRSLVYFVQFVDVLDTADIVSEAAPIDLLALVTLAPVSGIARRVPFSIFVCAASDSTR